MAVELFFINKFLYPVVPSVAVWQRISKISNLIKEEITVRISYERRVYESVDEKILPKAISQNLTKNRIREQMG